MFSKEFRRKMKGMTLLGELIGFIFLLVSTYFTSVIVIYNSNVSGMIKSINQDAGTQSFDLTIMSRILPIFQEEMVMAMTDIVYVSPGGQRFSIGVLLANALEHGYDKNGRFAVSIGGEEIFIDDAVMYTLDRWDLGSNEYYIALVAPDGVTHRLHISSDFMSGGKLTLQKVSFSVPTHDGYGTIVVYVG